MLGALHRVQLKSLLSLETNLDTGHSVNPEKSDNTKLKQADLPCRAKKKKAAIVYCI
ncbi:hypothetical protein G3A_22455 [Bacillus sp. 17376]|uniref:hypothetical protein n=1 Tax=Mesobacillus boroniphilus TaxID=308892 RepID=UPI0003C7821C|nr:hypothetical protein [Mesobacillus boroniphilus]ESU30355.1 hypothetical protein G3A_22455 [Bacillus sp. 17376]